MPKNAKASPQRAEAGLSGAKGRGWITDYRRIDIELGGGQTRIGWRIEAEPTRYEHHFDPAARGVIVLSSREVFAFLEGCFAGAHVQPNRRAGDAD